MIHKSFGEIPAAGELTAADEVAAGHRPRRLRHASVTSSAGTGRRTRLAEVMRIVGEVNKYVTDQAPFKLKAESERERLGTILHVARAGRRATATR